MVILLARTIAGLGRTPALLSRGYGRSETTPVVLPPGVDTLRQAARLGDEPALARRHEPRLWLGISKDRHGVGREIAGRAPDACFILDDGFQHRRLHRDLDLVLIDWTQPFAGNRMFPGGTLREPLRGLRRADIAMINGLTVETDADPAAAAVRRVHPDALVYRCEQKIESFVPLRDWRRSGPRSGSWCVAGPVFPVAAIGNPQRFRRDIEALGIEVRGGRFFRDHYRLLPEDWQSCLLESRAGGAPALVTTEKDAIKIPEDLDLPLFVSVQSTRVVEAEEFAQRVARVLGEER
jgi:tetraacyldisaccharide 4'-kinase